MTPTVEFDEFAFAGSILIVLALLIILYRVREGWSSSLGLLFAFVLACFHGLCEINHWLFPRGQWYRLQGEMDSQWIGTTVLVAGAGLLSFAIGYGLRPPKVTVGRAGEPMGASFQWLAELNPAFLTLWMICGAIYRTGGNNLLGEAGAVAYVASALFFYVNIPLMMLMALWLSAQHALGRLRTRSYALFMLLLAASFSLFGGNRQEVAVGALATFVLLHKFRIKHIPLRSLAGSLVVLGGMFLALQCVRSAVGRTELLATTPLERVQMVLDGLTLALSEERWQDTEETLTSDLGYRLDGNLFLCNLVRQEANAPSTSWDLEPIRISLQQIVPSFLWSSKHDRMYLNVKQYMYWGRHLPEVDYLETPLAEFYSCGGLAPMLAGMFLTGLAVAWLETKIADLLGQPAVASSPTGFLVGVATVCMAGGLTFVEVGLQNWTLSLRNVFVLWFAMQSARFFRWR